MVVYNEVNSSFEENIKKAINALRIKDYSAGEKYIKYAMLENYHSPEVHNLLGILAEFTEDLILACKHYRAACALDPRFMPASRNLERITSFYYRSGNTNPDYGDKPEEEKIIPYIIEYDKNNIGHLRKRSK